METVKITKVNFETGETKEISFTKSERMSMFNKARAAARKGLLDGQRVNRAFGLLQSGKWSEKLIEYKTTTKNCDCPDHVNRKVTCKHMIVAMLVARIIQVRMEEARKAAEEAKKAEEEKKAQAERAAVIERAKETERVILKELGF